MDTSHDDAGPEPDSALAAATAPARLTGTEATGAARCPRRPLRSGRGRQRWTDVPYQRQVDAPTGHGSRGGRHRGRARPVNELVVLLVLLVGYDVIRALPQTTASVAVRHAHQLLSVEGRLFSHLEVPLNTWLDAVPPLAVLACYAYAALHYLATPVVLLISRHRGGWRYWHGYWTLVLASGLALVAYALYPVAPPRLVPDLGIVDVLRDYADHGWWGSAASAPRGIGDATNQYAAMPSMHVGWAVWCGIQMWGFGTRPWRVLAVAYPTLLAVTVLATGNHYLLDVLAGAGCVLLAHLALRALLRRRRGVIQVSRRPSGSASGWW